MKQVKSSIKRNKQETNSRQVEVVQRYIAHVDTEVIVGKEREKRKWQNTANKINYHNREYN